MSLKDDLKLNTPRRTPNHATKSHVVKTNVDGKPKMIRFGEQGASTAGKPSPNDSAATKAKRKAFKDRHAKNIAKGPASAAYWANRVKWAKGGPVEDQRPANLRQIMTDVGADTLSGMLGPIASSAYSLGNQYFTDKSIEELEADKAAVDKALNYNPRTKEAQDVNEYAMGKMSEGVAALAEKYNENKDSLGYIPDMVDYGMEQYNELDPETRFAIENALTVGEVVPIGKLAGMAKGAVRNAGDRRMISDAASDVPDESSYLPLQDRLEEMGAKQNMADTDSIKGQEGSATTQVATTAGSYKKAVKKAEELNPQGKTVLDYGAGLGLGTDAMRSSSKLEVTSYEPFPERWRGDAPVDYTDSSLIKDKFDTVVNLNVLNVLEPELRDVVAKDIMSKVADGGVAIVGTRKWNGDVNAAKKATEAAEEKALWINKPSGDVYQKGFDGDELKDYMTGLAPEGFRVERGKGIAANTVYVFNDNKPMRPIMFRDVAQPDLTPDQLSRSFKDGEITNYGRNVARKRAAKDMAGQTAKVKKLSEVLGDMNIEGKVSMVATQSDRTGIKDGAGPGYPLIGRQYSEMAKLYQDQFGEAPVPRMLDKNGEITDYPVWAVDAKGTVASLRNNLREEGTILVPMIGSPGQLRTNKEVFKKLKKEFMAGIKANKLDADQADKINLNLEALTGDKMDIRDPSSWIELEKTFDGRGALADIMSGKTPQAIAAVGARSKWRTKLNKKRAADGLEPLDLNPKTAPLGARKGQIFDYDKILEDSTESVLLGAGTFDIGPSLILPSRYRQSETMRDAHPGFKEQLMGELASDDIFTPVPLEAAMPSFIDHGRGLHMRAGPNKRPFNSSAWGMNARMGYPGQGLPSQKIDEDYLKYLQDMGFAEGGEVEVAEEVSVEYNADKISAMADALMNGDSYAEGGEVKKQATRDDTIGYNLPNLRRVAGDVITDFASGIFGPIASSAISLGEQAFTDNTIEEMMANNEAYNDALNFNPRTKEAQAVNKSAMQGLGAVVNEGIEYYDRNKKHLSPEVQQSIAATGQAWEDLDPRTKFLIGNAATVGEVLPIGGAVRAGLRVGRNAVDQRNLNAAAGQVPSEASYEPLQDRLEGMGARQLQVREPGDNNFLNEYDSDVLGLGPERLMSPISTPQTVSNRLNIKLTDDDIDDLTDDELNKANDVVDLTERRYPGSTITNRWLNTKLKKYLQNELGTGQNDSIVRVAGDADNMHYEVTDYTLGIGDLDEQINLGQYNVEAYGLEYYPNMIRLDSESDLAKSFEGASDKLLDQQQAGTIRKSGLIKRRMENRVRNLNRRKDSEASLESLMDEMYEANPFLNKVPPETNMFTLNEDIAEELQLEVLTEGVRELVDPTNELGLPPELYLPGDKILKMSVGEVSARVGDLRLWKEKEMTKGFIELAQKSPRMIVDGFDIDFAKEKGATWVDIPDASSSKQNKKICTSLGKGGEWCTKIEKQALNYGSGNSSLTVMLDGDGRPHLQVQFIANYKNQNGDDIIDIKEIKPPGNEFDHQKSASYIRQDPLYETKLADEVINFLNKVDNEMIVGNINPDELELFGLVDVDDTMYMHEILDDRYSLDAEAMESVYDIYDVYMSHRRFSPAKTPRIVREEQIMDYMDSGVSDLDRSDFAKGGAVIAKYDADKINKLAQGIMPENFAEGGPVIYNASRINEIANQLLQEA